MISAFGVEHGEISKAGPDKRMIASFKYARKIDTHPELNPADSMHYLKTSKGRKNQLQTQWGHSTKARVKNGVTSSLVVYPKGLR